MARPWLRSLLLALPLLLAACGDSRRRVTSQPAPQTPAERQVDRQRDAQVAQRRRELARCLREGPILEAQMVALRRAEGHLARVKEETYVPFAPPTSWDEATESRYRLEDREADWQAHLQAQEDWNQREQRHRAHWMADHQERLRLAQGRLDRLTQDLRAQRPDLFTGPGSIEFNPEVVHRIRHCDARGSKLERAIAP